MIDEKLVYLARNAMLVSGMEMGKDGDHWPLVKANIHAMMRDYEQLKIETAVQEELRVHVGDIIKRYEKFLGECSDTEVRDAYAPHIAKMREVYDAMFAPVDAKNEARLEHEDDSSGHDENTGYVPWKSSAMIINQLFTEENADGSQ